MMPNEDDNYAFDPGPTFLVTGASGLLGIELVKQLLDKGFKVKAIYNSTPVTMQHANLQTFQIDILDVIALNEVIETVTHVYHCAGLVSFDKKDRDALFNVNIDGTANVVNACLDAGIKKLVHVSSVSALGRIREGELLNETMYWTEETSNSLYGKSKYLGEMEVWRGIGEGLNAVIVNPTIIFGGDDWDSGSMSIFKTAYNEFPWYTEGVSGFVDVRDVAQAMILLMGSEISAERIILNGENVPYRDIFTMIANQFYKKPPYKKVTPFLSEVVWRMEAVKSLFTGKKHLLTKETAHTAQTKSYFDNAKILKAFPEFQFTKIEKTIERTCVLMKVKYHL
ncbi:MAG: NAD-dependent epimerase/dehydratase family protein [Ginsengibacter sp.]